MNSVSPDLTSRTLGNWSLLRLLGEGGFGSVYEAEHTTIKGRRAAVKVLHPHLAFHKDIKRRFITEASIASQAEHEHIVQVFDGGVSEDGICYVAMELLRGQSLASLLRNERRLSAQRAIRLAVQITSALEVAHGLGVVHRDLKPDNIFLCQRKNNPDFVKVLDFGIAKLQSQESNTTSGAVLGTPLYMSPEQWQTLPDIDGRSDLYALGVILYQCLTGVSPYDGATSFAVMMAHMQGEIPDPAKVVPVPLDLGNLIRRLMSKDRAERPASARQVSNDLRRMWGEDIEPEEEVNPLGATPVANARPFVASKSISLRQHSGEIGGRQRAKRFGFLIVAAMVGTVLAILSTTRLTRTVTPTRVPSGNDSIAGGLASPGPEKPGAKATEHTAQAQAHIPSIEQFHRPDMGTVGLSSPVARAPRAPALTENSKTAPAPRSAPASRPAVSKSTIGKSSPAATPKASKSQDLYEVPLVR
jgi:serine/threonine-protein kinase